MKMMSKARELTEVLTEVIIFLSDPQDQAMPKLCHRPRRFHLIRRSKTLLIRVDLHTTHHLIRLREPSKESPTRSIKPSESPIRFWNPVTSVSTNKSLALIEASPSIIHRHQKPRRNRKVADKASSPRYI
ncbi:hypothetical protein LOK49_LG11G02319 [Camellia lanceoleosa]|uniref:Uncharacterized protein n=1 Tax=Camellia lanceoleosa TaxID=1840588 RepID=A0ACC0G6E2_9ERIC|nr:hypothetical protein LOK49_LG11G02319 [Camellia lanceoleosa]